MMKLQFKNILCGYNVDIPEEEIDEFCSIFEFKTFSKNEIILKQGDKKTFFAYIASGLIRYYYKTDEKEYNLSFKAEHQIFMNHVTSFSQMPSELNIQALEDTTTIFASYQAIEPYYSKSLAWANLSKKILEHNFLIKTEREKNLLTKTPLDIYKDLKLNHNALFKRLSKHHLSLYLGINPASLSRLLKSED